MTDKQDLTNLFSSLDAVLKDTDLADVTAESSGFDELPDGYYLCELEKAEIKESKTSHQPMAAMQFNIVDNGYGVDAEGNYFEIKNVKNRKIFQYYVLADSQKVKRFVTDMLKFEGEKEGEPILPKEAFTTSETVVDALDALVGMRLYIQSSTTEKDDGTKSVWKNLISWKRVKALELPN